jgi:hypothetical protein
MYHKDLSDEVTVALRSLVGFVRCSSNVVKCLWDPKEGAMKGFLSPRVVWMVTMALFSRWSHTAAAWVWGLGGGNIGSLWRKATMQTPDSPLTGLWAFENQEILPSLVLLESMAIGLSHLPFSLQWGVFPARESSCVCTLFFSLCYHHRCLCLTLFLSLFCWVPVLPSATDLEIQLFIFCFGGGGGKHFSLAIWEFLSKYIKHVFVFCVWSFL